ncbi:hypothetical protein CfE428DRAFT_2662 [Chthoniobacter flavus Ellin428]|uniref:Uncharacterized protein n=1 Tax=Chthoniobacter flavus Ellin428 TaxID=497964 RepID=B4D161_9BACT|nr:hypothetical protein [Chthoniobacter flavus]EDY20073.1 hypothetical protein CfE428DRAFT_2662 [Chthoniobacter flavus Ellin428]TCO93970.1 hypothetical protein EV701_10356 [Chthoniobacter flavus]
MNLRPVVFLFALFLLAGVGLGDDRIVSVDQQAKFMTVEQGGLLKLYRLTDTTDITVNGAKASIPQLLPGQTVAVKLAGSVTAVKVVASGLASNASSARPLALRTITIQMRVDGSDRLFYQDGKLWIEHMSAQKPANIFINGIEWTPNWNGDKTDVFTKFSVPVAPIGQGHVTMKQFAGRSKVRQEHSPIAPVVVTISDDPSGADDYEIQLSW